MNKFVYLDNNATTPIHPEVKRAVVDALDLYGNISSMHQVGQVANHAVEQARENIASFIGANMNEIVFTGSGTEANNAVIHSIYWNEQMAADTEGQQQASEKMPHVITSAIEHPAVLNTLEHYEKKGLEVTYLPVTKEGRVDVENVRNHIQSNTRLITIMYANNEIGVIQPVEEIAQIAQEHNVYFHTDAVQALGKIPFDVKNIGMDFMTLSGHKIFAPKGIGVLYIKNGTRFLPFHYGGHHENHRRAGTENTIGIIGMGKAIEMLNQNMSDEIVHVAQLKQKLKDGLTEKIPDISFNGDQENCLPNTLNVTFDYVEGESILLYADFEGIEVSTGSACSTGSLEPSHVIMALGKDPENAHGSVRFSLGRENTEDDIDYVLEKMPQVIERLRSMSPLYKK